MDENLSMSFLGSSLAESSLLEDDFFSREEFDLLNLAMETDRTERSISREPDSNTQQRGRQIVTQPVQSELCQLLELLSKGLTIVDRQREFSEYLHVTDERRRHLPALLASRRELVEAVDVLKTFLATLTKNDEKIFPDIRNLLPKLREFIDQRGRQIVTQPVQSESCQLLELLSKCLTIVDRQREFSEYSHVTDEGRTHLPALLASHRELVEAVDASNTFLDNQTLNAGTVDAMENTTVIDNHYPNTQPSEDLNFDE
uniref:Centrosomal protein of 70 kDa n=1 Tax=Trichobilharzia regenti TaxID=157069 RepID=A0AA85JKQ6_TRIRE|nr:unnamed protein product [Trichobilharzia regenti]